MAKTTIKFHGIEEGMVGFHAMDMFVSVNRDMAGAANDAYRLVRMARRYADSDSYIADGLIADDCLRELIMDASDYGYDCLWDQVFYVFRESLDDADDVKLLNVFWEDMREVYETNWVPSYTREEALRDIEMALNWVDESVINKWYLDALFYADDAVRQKETQSGRFEKDSRSSYVPCGTRFVHEYVDCINPDKEAEEFWDKYGMAIQAETGGNMYDYMTCPWAAGEIMVKVKPVWEKAEFIHEQMMNNQKFMNSISVWKLEDYRKNHMRQC